MYKQHEDKAEPKKILAQYKIGKLAGGAAASAGKVSGEMCLDEDANNRCPFQPSTLNLGRMRLTDFQTAFPKGP